MALKSILTQTSSVWAQVDTQGKFPKHISMSADSRKIVKHTSIYMVGDILRRTVSLIMLPIYTRYLTPEDYGVVELLSMVIDFSTIIFGARAGQAVFRYYCTATSQYDKKSVIASALLLSAVMNGIGAITISIFSGPLAIAVFSDIAYKNYIALFAFTMFLMPLVELPLTHMRAQQKPWLFLIFSISKLILHLSLNIYFVVYKEMHVDGVIYSALISSAVMAVILTGYSLSKTGLKARKSTCKKIFNFSLPLKLATIGSFYLTFGDRYLLNMFGDLSEVGIYSLGYKFGFIFILLVWTPFEKIWDTEKYNIYKKPDARLIYQKVFLYLSIIMILVGLCFSLLTKDLLYVMSDPAFHNAYKITPIIILAYMFQAWMKYCNFGILLSNNTIHIAYAEFIAVFIITIAYFTLIPAYGTYGAALATLIGFTARFYWVNRKAKQLYDMKLPWNKVFLTGVLASVIFSLSVLSPDDLVLSILFRMTLIGVFAATFLVLPILTLDEKKEIWHTIRRLKSTSGQ